MNLSLALIVEIGLYGAANLGALIYLLGGMRSEVQDHGRRLDCSEKEVLTLTVDVATIKGRLEAHI